MIELHFDTALITRELKRMEKIPYAVQRALYPAVSEVVDMARFDLVARLTADVPLPPKIIRQSIRSRVIQATAQGAEVHLCVASKAISLIEYDIDPKAVTARKGMNNKRWPSFSYALRKGERRDRGELEGREEMQGLPWIASMNNSKQKGRLGIYRKTDSGKIFQMYGPRMQYFATTPEVEADLIKNAEDNFKRILPRFVDQALAGASA